jgi:hypothetical protein
MVKKEVHTELYASKLFAEEYAGIRVGAGTRTGSVNVLPEG